MFLQVIYFYLPRSFAEMKKNLNKGMNTLTGFRSGHSKKKKNIQKQNSEEKELTQHFLQFKIQSCSGKSVHILRQADHSNLSLKLDTQVTGGHTVRPQLSALPHI